MHEHTIASKIIEDAKQYGNVKSLIVEVGDLAHLPADEMRHVLEDKTDWNIEVVSKKAVVACSCGYVGEPKILQQLHDNNIYECPECSTSLPTILDGSEIVLKEVEVFEDESFNENDYGVSSEVLTGDDKIDKYVDGFIDVSEDEEDRDSYGEDDFDDENEEEDEELVFKKKKFEIEEEEF